MGLEITFAPRMADIDRAEWDGLFGERGWPLLSWGYLALLEESGSIAPATGWTPAHLLAREGGRLVAAAPFYAKSHSMGEFVFDFAFADAARRAGRPWYPKLVGMVPATPAPAWRIAAAPEAADGTARAVLDAAAEAARDAGLAGLHVLWPDLGEGDRARPRGASTWEHQSYLWTDGGWGDFEGMLASFSKNMRRNVRREREAVRAAGIETRVLDAGEAAREAGILGLMADLYESHNDKFGPWAARFLERDFFLRLPEFLPEGWAISAGFERRGPALPPEPVALAFLLEGRDRLYGRYWGSRREVPCLHFELCYYLPMERALARGVREFDPGMGGGHKARRGFRSLIAPSHHAPFDRALASLLARSLPAFNAEEEAAAAALDAELPYKAASVR